MTENKKNPLFYHLMKATKDMAMNMAVLNVNSTCTGIIHQPKVPAEMAKFKK